ncbi:MAG: DUF3750 domain-containing protein [Bdellovibrionales bacterium]|nr:DUF3750 domain-containing protein [Bdellovibrionales bacterium]
MSYKTANRESARISPLPKDHPEAIVQVFYARTFGWRGKFAVHSWIAFKEKNAEQYWVTQVLGWRKYRKMSVVALDQDLPDRIWFDHMPVLQEQLEGAKAEEAIIQIQKAIQSYPYPDEYIMWPGPNSNSYIAHIIRNVDLLKIELPPHAIGKDRLMKHRLLDVSMAGRGLSFSLYGVVGFTLGLREGIEFHILTLCFGLDFLRPALKLPFLGRVGLKDA